MLKKGSLFIFSLESEKECINKIFANYKTQLYEEIKLIYNNWQIQSINKIADLFGKLGNKDWRIRHALYHGRFLNVKQCIRYLSQGIHFCYCCDYCGVKNFSGTRYACTICYDYDLCSKCYSNNTVFKHRYKYEKYWKKSNEACHLVSHEMKLIHLDNFF
jgi:hypothetical protein